MHKAVFFLFIFSFIFLLYFLVKQGPKKENRWPMAQRQAAAAAAAKTVVVEPGNIRA